MHNLICSFCKQTFTRPCDRKIGRFCSKKCARRSWHARNKEKENERARAWREANPEKYKEIRRASDEKHREEINAYAREWRAKHGHNGLCPICGKDGKLVYEHCHKTGLHRGYVCRNCSTGLGMFQDSLEILRKAVQYLER